MKKAVTVLLGCCVIAVVGSLVLTSQDRIHHEGSFAFDVALNDAVDRLENGARAAFGATAVMMNAMPAPVAAGLPGRPTFQGEVTCDPAKYTCEDYRHTADAVGHTCDGKFTCQTFPGSTCDTYDPGAFTCDPNLQECVGGFPVMHTFEPPPWDHTCQPPCRFFTADITRDPRAHTCDAGDPQCMGPTFEVFQTTCNPHDPSCIDATFQAICPPWWRFCTVQSYYTCDPSIPDCADTYQPGFITCDPNDPNCFVPTWDWNMPTCDPTDPQCIPTGIKDTTWGVLDQDVRVRPNPFRTSTSIDFNLSRPANVRVDVYDAAGRLVKKLVDGQLAQGSQTVTWDGRDEGGRSVSSGVYYARILGDGISVTKRLVVVE